jgi:hypothetical protein
LYTASITHFIKSLRQLLGFAVLAVLMLINCALAQDANRDFEIVRLESPISWLQAVDEAAALGGHLAVITSQDEQDHIRALLAAGDTAWIGGYDLVVEGTWVWANGAGWGYANWKPGHPDPVDGRDYLQVTFEDNGQWLAASGTCRAFIVEYGCCENNIAGNVDCDPDQIVDILDIIRLIDYKFKFESPLCCLDEANTNGDSADLVDILDIVHFIDYKFKDDVPNAPCSPQLIDPSEMVYITDRNGMTWDVTHGVHYYGMNPDNFNYGLGTDAIPPILNPQFLSPGDAGYPAPSETFEVLGVTIEGESRAYPLQTLLSHEVADDIIGTSRIAPAY